MRHRACMIVTLLCMIAVSATGLLAQEAEMPPEMKKAASAGLEDARRVVAQSNNPALLGLESARDADRARLGTPVAVSTLSFDALLDHRPDTPLESYLAGPARAVVPVLVDGEVRAWLTLRRDEERWRMTASSLQRSAGSPASTARAVRSRSS